MSDETTKGLATRRAPEGPGCLRCGGRLETREVGGTRFLECPRCGNVHTAGPGRGPMRFKCSRCESRLDVNYARGARFMVCRGCGTYAFEPFEVVMERLPQGGKRP